MRARQEMLCKQPRANQGTIGGICVSQRRDPHFRLIILQQRHEAWKEVVMQRLHCSLPSLPLQRNRKRGIVSGQGLTHPPRAVFNCVTDEREDVMLCLVVDAAVLQGLKEGGREGGVSESIAKA